MKQTFLRPVTLIFSCVAAFALVTLAGCSCDNKPSSSNSSATMTTDSKDMKHQ